MLLAGTLSSFAQDRRHAVGLRMGGTFAVTYDYLHNEFSGFSGMMSFREKGVQVTGMLKFYRPAFERVTDRFWWYAGVGGHVGYHKWTEYFSVNQGIYTYYYEFNRYSPVMGLDGLIGLEFRMDILPICFGVEYMPYFDLFGKNFFKLNYYDFGFTIKYAFN